MDKKKLSQILLALISHEAEMKVFKHELASIRHDVLELLHNSLRDVEDEIMLDKLVEEAMRIMMKVESWNVSLNNPFSQSKVNVADKLLGSISSDTMNVLIGDLDFQLSGEGATNVDSAGVDLHPGGFVDRNFVEDEGLFHNMGPVDNLEIEGQDIWLVSLNGKNGEDDTQFNSSDEVILSNACANFDSGDLKLKLHSEDEYHLNILKVDEVDVKENVSDECYTMVTPRNLVEVEVAGGDIDVVGDLVDAAVNNNLAKATFEEKQLEKCSPCMCIENRMSTGEIFDSNLVNTGAELGDFCTHLDGITNMLTFGKRRSNTRFSSVEDEIRWHFKDEMELVRQYGGSGFDCHMFDVRDNEIGFFNAPPLLGSLFPARIINRGVWGDLEDLHDWEKVIVNYVLDPTLSANEIVFLGDKVIGRRADFLTLNAHQLVSARVVNCLVEILSAEEVHGRGKRRRCWWIPTVLSSEGKKWEEWCGEVGDCEKAYAPVLAKRHWFLAILKFEKNLVELYDNLKIPSTPFGLAIIENMLESMDNAFSKTLKEVRGSDFCFRGFHIEQPVSHSKECIQYDCGVYVMKMLLQEYVPEVLSQRTDDKIDDLELGKCVRSGPTNVATKWDRQLIAGSTL
ncbi:uncharacterized protein LOC133819055 isoform X2 [Humulus lupulus]|uniref:uncharacterized protein LOC133819055 isoform X2 n=1 Tax=Humulus lupulus TaxID=3486 RepID=UPI002B406AF7|nr:uncharacterized protein LOC133819055 isoform X2 [Humulus lupulus]